ncbi:hypothetical protein HYV86_06520 [Candidatus Woesearchaeota archaeon]|nr:hypothetical protein [Candidatus Woesearchaeota archaeon]
MSRAVVTFKIMPEDPEVQLEPIKAEAQKIAKNAGAIGDTKATEEPFAFGLKIVRILGMFNVETSDFEAMAEEMARLEGVQSAEVEKMDLALG